MMTHTRNWCSAFNPSKCTHTQQWVVNKHTLWTHTRSSGQPLLQRPGEQLGVRCLAQGHLSHGIEGGESAVHSQSPPTIPAGVRIEPANQRPSGYKPNSLTIRPQLQCWADIVIPPHPNTVFGKKMTCTTEPLKGINTRWKENTYFNTFSRSYIIG